LVAVIVLAAETVATALVPETDVLVQEVPEDPVLLAQEVQLTEDRVLQPVVTAAHPCVMLREEPLTVLLYARMDRLVVHVLLLMLEMALMVHFKNSAKN
jgi:hypothetical protein